MKRNLKNLKLAGAAVGWAYSPGSTFIGLSFILGNVITVKILEVLNMEMKKL